MILTIVTARLCKLDAEVFAQLALDKTANCTYKVKSITHIRV